MDNIEPLIAIAIYAVFVLLALGVIALLIALADMIACIYKHDNYSRRFVFYFYHSGWDHISLGIHLDWLQPNFELHVPFGFFRIGWVTEFMPLPHPDAKYAYRAYGRD